MIQAEVDIANEALLHLKQDPIPSLSGTGTAATTMNFQYPRRRDAMIQRYRWVFCIKRAERSPIAAAPDFGFAHQFLLPSDLIEFIGIYDESEPENNYTSSRIPYKHEGGHILCDENPLRFFYKRQVTDPTKFDPLFSTALALDMARVTCGKFNGSAALLREINVMFKDTIAEARRSHAIQTMPETIQASEWVDSRLATQPFRPGPVV